MRLTYRTSFQVSITASLILTASSSNCRAQATPQPSPRLAADRASWQESISRTPLPKHGCFHASYPSIEWTEVTCVAAPSVTHGPTAAPLPSTRANERAKPKTVSGNLDFSATVPPGGGAIDVASGAFPLVSGVAGEKDSSFGLGAFTLQLNANKVPASICGANPQCWGWEQFIFANYPGHQLQSGLFIQYWLLYLGEGPVPWSCPDASWAPVSPNPPYSLGGCVKNSQMIPFGPVEITDLPNLLLSGYSTNSTDTAQLLNYGNQIALAIGADSLLDLSQYWNTVEFNIFGGGDGSNAVFPSSGSTLAVEIGLHAPSFPTCIVDGYTGESTNLTVVPYLNPAFCLTFDIGLQTGTTAQIEFMESNVTAPTYPIPTADAASSRNTTSAQLNGSVDTSGSPMLVWFQYSTTSEALDCISQPLTPQQPVDIPANASYYFNSVASQLSSDTTYYYVACALNGAGLASSSPMNFTTFTQQSVNATITAVVNGASFVGGGVVPGEIATAFGTNLTSSTGINLTSGLPLPATFLNDTLMVNNTPVALFAVDNVNGQQQINFQVPWEVASGPNASFAIANNSTTSASISLPVLAAQPGIFNYSVGENTFGSILHANFQLANTANPAMPGETVLIYCTGLGAVDSPPTDGEPGDGQSTMATPTVTIGGTNATVSFSGLAPDFVGLYQVNVEVPKGLATGNQPVVIAQAGASSNSVLLPVQ